MSNRLPPRPPGLRPSDLLREAPFEQFPTWSDYFNEHDVLDLPEGKRHFSCYFDGNWTHGCSDPVVVFFHGAGHSALTWSLLNKRIAPHARTVAFDCRGHGDTQCEDEVGNLLPISTLVQDSLDLIACVRERLQARTGNVAPLILCGHSLGGAVAIRVAKQMQEEGREAFALIVLDVVEGVALDALNLIHHFVSQYPKSFPNLERAVTWSLTTVLRSPESARISIPHQLREDGGLWYWRVDLASSAPYWREWFEGMDDDFLGVRCLKILVLAGAPHDRLDKKLTMAHMEGKFQLSIIAKTGHVIQEDQSDQLAEVLLSFLTRCKVLAKLTI